MPPWCHPLLTYSDCWQSRKDWCKQHQSVVTEASALIASQIGRNSYTNTHISSVEISINVTHLLVHLKMLFQCNKNISDNNNDNDRLTAFDPGQPG